MSCVWPGSCASMMQTPSANPGRFSDTSSTSTASRYTCQTRTSSDCTHQRQCATTYLRRMWGRASMDGQACTVWLPIYESWHGSHRHIHLYRADCWRGSQDLVVAAASQRKRVPHALPVSSVTLSRHSPPSLILGTEQGHLSRATSKTSLACPCVALDDVIVAQ